MHSIVTLCQFIAEITVPESIVNRFLTEVIKGLDSEMDFAFYKTKW